MLSKQFFIVVSSLVLNFAYGASVGQVEVIPATENAIPNQYIVKLKSNPNSRISNVLEGHLAQLDKFINESQNSRLGNTDNKVEFKYNSVLTGYSGKFNENVLQWIKSSPEVERIEQDGLAQAIATQDGAPWGLGRISQREPVLNESNARYRYDSITGQGVDVYVLDTGVNINHEDLEGRGRQGKNFTPDDNITDGHGHGTHVAGTIAGRKFGVAKGANIIGVKVLANSGSGSWSGIIAGIEYVVTDPPRWGTPIKGKVINMSIGGGKIQAINDAVNSAVDAGVHVVVAAGNEATDACIKSPASAEKAITVGATTINDTLASFSNFGKCVDILAPGRFILSSWIGENNATKNISGTSMASPHVAGLVAYQLSLADSIQAAQALTPSVIIKKLQDLATKDAIKDLSPNTVNLLAFNDPPAYSNNKY